MIDILIKTLATIVYFAVLGIALILYAKLILWKMHQDLEEWISYGNGMDIYDCPDQRKEYAHYVARVPKKTAEGQYPAKQCLLLLRADLHSSKLKPIYFQILWLLIKGKKFN